MIQHILHKTEHKLYEYTRKWIYSKFGYNKYILKTSSVYIFHHIDSKSIDSDIQQDTENDKLLNKHEICIASKIIWRSSLWGLKT